MTSLFTTAGNTPFDIIFGGLKSLMAVTSLFTDKAGVIPFHTAPSQPPGRDIKKHTEHPARPRQPEAVVWKNTPGNEEHKLF